MNIDNQVIPIRTTEIIADNLHEAGWSLGWVSAVDLEGRTIWIVDAHRDGKRFIVRADDLLTAFVDRNRRFAKNRIDAVCQRVAKSHLR